MTATEAQLAPFEKYIEAKNWAALQFIYVPEARTRQFAYFFAHSDWDDPAAAWKDFIR